MTLEFIRIIQVRVLYFKLFSCVKSTSTIHGTKMHGDTHFKAVLKKEFSPLSPIEKRLNVLRSHFVTKMLEIFRNC